MLKPQEFYSYSLVESLKFHDHLCDLLITQKNALKAFISSHFDIVSLLRNDKSYEGLIINEEALRSIRECHMREIQGCPPDIIFVPARICYYIKVDLLALEALSEGLVNSRGVEPSMLSKIDIGVFRAEVTQMLASHPP